MLKPNKKYIIVEPKKSEKQTKSGILLPDNEENINQGTVVSIGGSEPEYSIGDIVIFKYGIVYKNYLIVKKEDIIAYIK